jgi:DNA-binding MarR family transcriptional regulator
MKEELGELNENDQKLLALCNTMPHSISDIARFLRIAPKNVSARINKLVKKKLIRVERKGQGKRTIIRTIGGMKIDKYMKKILGEIKNKGGEVSAEEYSKMPLIKDLNESIQNEYDILRANMYLHHTIYLKRMIRITPQGLKFIKDKSPPK